MLSCMSSMRGGAMRALRGVFVLVLALALSAPVLAAELSTSDRWCPDVDGEEYAEPNIPVDNNPGAVAAEIFGLKCNRVNWMLPFEDPYGVTTHFQCDEKWTYQWRDGMRPIRRENVCDTGF